MQKKEFWFRLLGNFSPPKMYFFGLEIAYAKEIVLVKVPVYVYNFSVPKMRFFGLEIAYAKERVLLKLMFNFSPPKICFLV